MIVFLDFDGVINSHDWWRRRGPRPRPTTQAGDARWSFDPAAVQRLNRLAEAGARFVISSTWRIMNDVDSLATMLRACGFTGEVIGATPDLADKSRSIHVIHARRRGDEIQAWLDANGRPPFVILDDDDDMGPLLDRLVRTSFDHGLLDEHIDRALAMLRAP